MKHTMQTQAPIVSHFDSDWELVTLHLLVASPEVSSRHA